MTIRMLGIIGMDSDSATRAEHERGPPDRTHDRSLPPTLWRVVADHRAVDPDACHLIYARAPLTWLDPAVGDRPPCRSACDDVARPTDRFSRHAGRLGAIVDRRRRSSGSDWIALAETADS